tara:strand:+ start:75 stop:806 length:732 start_codon:yes stop_codon:yes gene_type:complete
VLSNYISVITGSSSGIGLETLKLFLKNNSIVAACYNKNSSELDKLKIEYPNNLFLYSFDFSDEDQTKTAAKNIVNKFDKINVLINNAGSISTSLFQMTTIENLKKMFDINFFNQMLFTQIISKKMIRNKSGSIVNVSSSSAIDGNDGRFSYATSKAALLSASKVFARELSHFNIRSNVVAPGLTETSLMRDSHDEKNIKKQLDNQLIKRVAAPIEIANLILFLASDKSSYITGQIIRIDGGMN